MWSPSSLSRSSRSASSTSRSARSPSLPRRSRSEWWQDWQHLVLSRLVEQTNIRATLVEDRAAVKAGELAPIPAPRRERTSAVRYFGARAACALAVLYVLGTLTDPSPVGVVVALALAGCLVRAAAVRVRRGLRALRTASDESDGGYLYVSDLASRGVARAAGPRRRLVRTERPTAGRAAGSDPAAPVI